MMMMIIVIIIFTHLNKSRLTSDFKFQHLKSAATLDVSCMAGIVPIDIWPPQSQTTGLIRTLFSVFAVSSLLYPFVDKPDYFL